MHAIFFIFLKLLILLHGVCADGVFNRQHQYVMLIRCQSCRSVLVWLLVWLNAVLASFCCVKLLLVVW